MTTAVYIPSSITFLAARFAFGRLALARLLGMASGGGIGV
jgi:hypothetical protein